MKIDLKLYLINISAMEACIYKIELNDMIYIGSTINMKKRQYTHNRDLKKGCDSQIYKYCRENGINEIQLLLLECVPIEDRYVVEQYYIDEFKGDKLLNFENAVFDREKYEKIYLKSYYQTNREKLREQQKAYYQANKDRINEKQRLYRARKKAEKSN